MIDVMKKDSDHCIIDNRISLKFFKERRKLISLAIINLKKIKNRCLASNEVGILKYLM